jgi:hypothetical protein
MFNLIENFLTAAEKGYVKSKRKRFSLTKEWYYDFVRVTKMNSS